MLLEKPYWVVEYLGCHTAKSLVSKVVQFQVFQIIIQSTHDASNYGNKNRPLIYSCSGIEHIQYA